MYVACWAFTRTPLWFLYWYYWYGYGSGDCHLPAVLILMFTRAGYQDFDHPRPSQTIPEHPSRTIPSTWSLIWTWCISPPWTERSWGRWCGAACVMHLVIAVALWPSGWKVSQLGPGLTSTSPCPSPVVVESKSGIFRDHEMLDYQLILFVFVVRLVSVNFGAAFRHNLTFLVPCAICDTRSTRPGVKWNWDPSTPLCPVEFQTR